MKFPVWRPVVLIFFVVGLSYFNALHNEFVWDDEFLIQKNEYLRDFKYLPKMLISNSTAGFGGKDNFYRPTQNIYYLFIYQLFGMSPVAFHLGNILIHLLNAFLIYLLTLRLFQNSYLALITCLLWASHPTHVEAVTYISGTADPMGTLFCLLCCLLFPLKWQRDKLKLYILSLLCFALALLSKEAMIVTPALLTLLIFFRSKGRMPPWKPYLTTLPFWLLASSYMLLRKTWLNFDQTFDFYKAENLYTENLSYRVYTYLATLPDYLVILLRPTHLHMERQFPVYTSPVHPAVIGGFVICFASLGLGLFFYLKDRKDLGLLSGAWFFTAFVPMMGILIPVNSFILEHWLYLPSIGFFIFIAASIMKSQRIIAFLPTFIASILIIVSMSLTHERNKDWRTPIRFYSNILEYTPGSARVHNNLAMAYAKNKLWDLAIRHYQRAIATSDSYPQTHYNLARIYAQKEQWDQALSHLQRSLEIDPHFIYAQKLKEKIDTFLKSK